MSQRKDFDPALYVEPTEKDPITEPGKKPEKDTDKPAGRVEPDPNTDKPAGRLEEL